MALLRSARARRDCMGGVGQDPVVAGSKHSVVSPVSRRYTARYEVQNDAKRWKKDGKKGGHRRDSDSRESVREKGEAPETRVVGVNSALAASPECQDHPETLKPYTRIDHVMYLIDRHVQLPFQTGAKAQR